MLMYRCSVDTQGNSKRREFTKEEHTQYYLRQTIEQEKIKQHEMKKKNKKKLKEKLNINERKF